MKSFLYVVLSQITMGRNGLFRYADLSHNGHYHIFRKVKMFRRTSQIETRFSIRTALPMTVLWHLDLVRNSNEKDPSKDYILSDNMDLDAIEVVTISEASNLDNLINLLKNGIEYQPHSHRVMFAFYASKGQYMGILCNTQELNTVNGKTAFAEDCIEVPVYEFTGGNILRLDNGLSFYRNALLVFQVSFIN